MAEKTTVKPTTVKPASAKPAAVKKPVPAKPVAVVAKAVSKPPVPPVAVARPIPSPVPTKPVSVEPAAAVTPVAKQVVAAPSVIPPVAAKPVIAKPVAAKPAAKPVAAKPVDSGQIVVAKIPVKIASRISAPLTTEGEAKMTETLTKIEEVAKNFAAEATTKVKAAMEKGTKSVSELVEFSKGNVEAVVASGKIAAKGVEEIAKYATDYGRSSIEKANETAKRISAVKSPTEFFQLQSDIAKTSLESFVGEASKFGENYMKLLGEIAQPIHSRYALAVEKVKSAVAV
ncbi:hypothetical protein BH09PSE3_BH09PSE3_17300 [soil metagenome]